MSKENEKRIPGRPRIHEVGKWTALQFRMPMDLRHTLMDLLEKKNKDLSYRLSLNSLLLYLVNEGLAASSFKEDHAQKDKSEDKKDV